MLFLLPRNNAGTHTYGKKRSSAEYHWRPPPNGCDNFNVDASRRHCRKSTLIGYVIRYHPSKSF